MDAFFQSGDVWVLIPLAGILCGMFAIAAAVYGQHLKVRMKEIEAMSQRTRASAAQKATDTTALEERVRVLERIATDKGMDVSAEIERLRSENVN